jgi:putative peptide zinc metalloprotease protein
LPGTFVRKGATLAYVFEATKIGVRAVVPEVDAALVRQDSRRVTVRMADHPAQSHAAELVREVPAATRELPSAALGDRGGGMLVTDPADRDGIRTLQPFVVVDLALGATDFERAGARTWVRFEHGASPLAQQWYRRLRQVFLKQFNPVS